MTPCNSLLTPSYSMVNGFYFCFYRDRVLKVPIQPGNKDLRNKTATEHTMLRLKIINIILINTRQKRFLFCLPRCSEWWGLFTTIKFVSSHLYSYSHGADIKSWNLTRNKESCR